MIVFYRKKKDSGPTIPLKQSFSKKDLRLSILIILMGIGSLFSQDCSYSLSGRIIDLHDDSVIEGALITTNQEGVFAQTDSKGYYFISDLCVKKLELEISHPSCKTIQKKINLRGNEVINIRMEHHINELEEIVVSDNSIKGLIKTGPEIQLNSDIIDAYSGQNLGDALASVSGVSMLKTGSGIIKPMVHGMYGSRVGIVNNAFRLQDQEWGADHAPNVDMNAYENIQLIKGAAALKYGGDTPGGIIVLSTLKPYPKDSLYGKTILNGAANGRGKVVISDLTKSYQSGFYFNIQGTFKEFGDHSSRDYLLTNSGFSEKNISVKFGKNRITKGWEAGYSFYSNTIGILKSSHIGNIEDLARAISSNVPLFIGPYSNSIIAPKQESSHHNAYVKWFLRFGSSSKLNIDYNFQFNNRNEFDIRRGVPSTTPAIDLELTTHNIAADLEWKQNENSTFNIGMVGQFQDNYSDPETGIRRLIPDYFKYQLGAYNTWVYSPNNTFSFDLGVRFDYIHLDAKKFYKRVDWEDMEYEEDFGDLVIRQEGNQFLVNPIFKYFNTSINSGITLGLSDSLNGTVNYILSQRAPNPSELFSDGLHHSLAVIELGDLRLEKEVTHKALVSLDYKKNFFNLELTPFYSYSKNYIYSEPTTLKQTVRGAFPVWQYRSTPARFFGADLDFSYRFSRSISFKSSTAYVHAKDLNRNLPLIAIPPLNSTQYLIYKKPSGRWEFQISTRSVLEQKRFPDLNFEIPIFNGETTIRRNVDISTPPEGYTLLDMNATFHLNKKDKKDITLRISSTNVFNVSYRDYLNRLRYYSDEMGRQIQVQLIFKY